MDPARGLYFKQIVSAIELVPGQTRAFIAARVIRSLRWIEISQPKCVAVYEFELNIQIRYC